MPSNLNLDYYYGTEAEQYSFYRVPKTLLTDPRYKALRPPAGPHEPVYPQRVDGQGPPRLHLLHPGGRHGADELRQGQGHPAVPGAGPGRYRPDRAQEAGPGPSHPDLRQELYPAPGTRPTVTDATRGPPDCGKSAVQTAAQYRCQDFKVYPLSRTK